LAFCNSKTGIIESMYVVNTAYGLTYCRQPGIRQGEYVTIVATGYAPDGSVTGVTEFTLVDGPSRIVDRWTRWSLKSLGHVSRVSFNVKGNIRNDYGFCYPAYFAFDDVRVILD
ncbi:MAG: DUF4465 domain-containing protein, partial [Bacteroidales bacterium]|nr:DUF4465 domain-containing protein [Bacteroidales bacterium]